MFLYIESQARVQQRLFLCVLHYNIFLFFNLVWENVNVVQYYKRDLVSNLASFVMAYIIYSQQREKESVGLVFCSSDTK